MNLQEIQARQIKITTDLEHLSKQQNDLRSELDSIGEDYAWVRKRIRTIQRSANVAAMLAFITGVLVGVFLAQFIRW